MNLEEFKTLLSANPEKAFRLKLPNGNAVPISFHITEVGRLQKTFLDCGGQLHEKDLCLLQVWVGEDEDHRVQTGKMAGILKKAESFLPSDSVPLEIEYEDEMISQYTVDGHVVDDDSVVLKLAHKHTACLAMQLCGPAPKKEKADEQACCASSGCC